MYAIIIPLIALGLFWGYVSGNADLTVAVAIATVVAGVVSLVFALIAAYLHKLSRLASIAMGGATIALMVLVASLFALAAWLVAILVNHKSPVTASTTTNVIATLTGAIVTGLITYFAGKPFFPTGPTVAKQFLSSRLQSKYPSMPVGPPQAIDAYTAVRDACAGEPTVYWTMRRRIVLFRNVNEAVAAGAYYGGSAWTPAMPPRPRANPDAADTNSNSRHDDTSTADADHTPPDEGKSRPGGVG